MWYVIQGGIIWFVFYLLYPEFTPAPMAATVMGVAAAIAFTGIVGEVQDWWRSRAR